MWSSFVKSPLHCGVEFSLVWKSSDLVITKLLRDILTLGVLGQALYLYLSAFNLVGNMNVGLWVNNYLVTH